MNINSNVPQLVSEKRPSEARTLFDALCYGKQKERVDFSQLPQLSICWRNIHLSSAYITTFEDICGVERSGYIPTLYPFSLLYPMTLWLLSRKEIHIPMFKLLTIRNCTTHYRAIAATEILEVNSRITGQKIVKNGLEFYIESEIRSQGELVWSNLSALFAPGSPGDRKQSAQPRLAPIINAEQQEEWIIAAANRYRFSRMMGDSNGIHYMPLWAKMLGYRRDFAQPMRVLSAALKFIPKHHRTYPITLESHYKGPVYYNKKVSFYGAETDAGYRFDLYAEGNARPCIQANIRKSLPGM